MRAGASVALVLLAALVPVVQGRLEGGLQSPAEKGPLLFSESPERLRLLVPGFELLLADVYWLRTVQYYGSEHAFSPDPRYAQLRALIDITTTLDPRLELAYRYGAVFLSEEWPNGASKPAEGLEVLEKGVKALPGSWRLRWDLGAHWFFYMKDAKRAAGVLREAATIKDAPYWLENVAAKFLEGDDRASAREIWRRQYETGEGNMKENALYNLQVLNALDVRDSYNAAIERFRAAKGRVPASLGELAAGGYVRDPAPRDPSGAPFRYDAANGRVGIARDSRLWRSKYE